MNANQLRTFQSDPAAFRAALTIDADGQPIRLGEALEHWQDADFRATDPMWLTAIGRPQAGVQRAYLERPRGHSKTTDIAVMVAWAIAFAPRLIRGGVAAADRDQAKLTRDAVLRLCKLNPWLDRLLDVQNYRIANRHTDSECQIISNDAASSWGLLVDFIVCDEMSVWPSEDLWSSLASAASKRGNCCLIVISNAGMGRGTSWQWRVREACRTSNRWHFHTLDGPAASWITQERLDELRILLPGPAYARVVLNRWQTGSGDAIETDLIDRAIKTIGKHPAEAWRYVAGLDIGIRHDRTGLVVVGKHLGHVERIETPRHLPRTHPQAAMREMGILPPLPPIVDHKIVQATGRLQVAASRSWHPAEGKVSLEDVRRECNELHREYHLAALDVDPHQAEYLAERLKRDGIPVRLIPQTGKSLPAQAAATLAAFQAGLIEIPPTEEQLIEDLRQLRAVEKSYGVRLTSPKGPSGHGDSATALSIALAAARQLKHCVRPPKRSVVLNDDPGLLAYEYGRG